MKTFTEIENIEYINAIIDQNIESVNTCYLSSYIKYVSTSQITGIVTLRLSAQDMPDILTEKSTIK